MRIIKFRAWIQKLTGGYMAYQGEPDLATLESFIFHYGDKPLEQFTGCYDKNNKEIFEGDIVNGLSFNGSYKYGQVIYQGNQFIIIPIGKISEGTSDDFNSCEVIGNIHQNPELL